MNIPVKGASFPLRVRPILRLAGILYAYKVFGRARSRGEASILKSKIILFVFLVGLVALVGWRFSENQKKEAAATAGSPGGGAAGSGGGNRGGGGAPGGGGGGARASAVEVAVAAPATISGRLVSVGTAQSPFRVELSPRASGLIETINVREGDRVTKGQILFTLDPSVLSQQVAQQEANVAEAKSRLAQAQIGSGPNVAGVQGAVVQAKAGLTSAQANLRQLRQNYDAQVAAADAAVTEQAGRVAAAEAQVTNANAALEREKASLANLQARAARLEALYAKGYVSGQEVDNAKTDGEVQRKQVDVAAAQVASAKSSLDAARANLAATKNQASIVRRKGNADIDAGAATVSQAKASVQVAGANRVNTSAYSENIRALRASVEAAEAQLQQARVQLANASVRSSIDGVVTARNADPGALASPGTTVLVVQSLDWLYINTSIPLEQSSDISSGQTAEVTFDSLPGKTFRAAVSNINPAADVTTRQIQILLKLPNPESKVKPGMYASVSFLTSTVRADIAIPREAIRQVNGKSVVSTVDDQSVAHDQEVTIGTTDGKLVEIKSGLTAGQKVITLAYQPARDGSPVVLPGAKAGKRP